MLFFPRTCSTTTFQLVLSMLTANNFKSLTCIEKLKTLIGENKTLVIKIIIMKRVNIILIIHIITIITIIIIIKINNYNIDKKNKNNK